MTAGREPLSRPSSRHGEARQTLTLPLNAYNRASGQRNRQSKKLHPERGGASRHRSRRRKGGACRLSQPALRFMSAGSECVRGPCGETPRPQECAGTAHGTERVASPAPRFGALWGVPAEVGVKKTHSGFDQGGNLLPHIENQATTPAYETR